MLYHTVHYWLILSKASFAILVLWLAIDTARAVFIQLRSAGHGFLYRAGSGLLLAALPLIWWLLEVFAWWLPPHISF